MPFTRLARGGPLDGVPITTDHRPKDGEIAWHGSTFTESQQIHLYRFSETRRRSRWMFVHTVLKAKAEDAA